MGETIHVHAAAEKSLKSAAVRSDLKVAAFLFDLDGTLVDTEEAWAGAIVDFLAECGVEMTVERILPSIVGRNWLDINRSLHQRFPEIGDTTVEEDSRRLRKFFNARVADPTTMIIPESVEFMKRVASKAPVAIVSGSPRADIEKAARMMGVDGLVRFSLGAGDYAKGKPDPSSYLAAAERFGVNPDLCVVIEDSEVGVAAGVAAGMRVIALDRRGNRKCDFNGAWRIVRSLDEIDAEKEFE